jgi:outer membrane protein assembly factor BamB
VTSILVRWLIAGALVAVRSLALQEDQDWPHWMGPTRDGVWHEAGVLDHVPAGGLEVEWRAPIGRGFSGPSVVGDRVYVTDLVGVEGALANAPSAPERVSGRERVLCLDAATGELLWEHAYDIAYAVSYPGGPRASPAVADGRVVTLGTDGDLRCLDAVSGELLWSRRFADDFGAPTPFWGHSAHPLIDGQRLFCLVGGEGSTVVAFDVRTGTELWRALSAPEPGYAPPVLATLGGEQELLVWHPESLNALDPANGELSWTLDLPARSGMTVTGPIVQDERLYLSGIATPPALIEVARDDAGAASPGFLWRGHARRGVTAANSTPVLVDGVLYGVDTKGQLVACDFQTGERHWTTFAATTGTRRESYSTAFLVRNGDRFFLFNEHGDLVVADLSEDGYTELGRQNLLEPTTTTYGREVVWSHPAFARRRVYARNDRELVCVSLEAPVAPEPDAQGAGR